ncbi:FAD/FMN-containing dehydrogenase [Parafrankia irregularis]|uniref:FAD/FMN-containing dehydrogenase n=1 Tax=Parafrankia irregularis TaxID=795642 RepID=A0A0S4QPA5_9ACTN|nr:MULTISPECIES: FAD-binding oxidoreductase [Parafrankia]MBE3204294.1 FAD-binding oxidoreductase [Parafrankia sp. CH37]CUU57267.1 FAD/FMN-containing dehydrogenase [Parafrankia irregularis]
MFDRRDSFDRREVLRLAGRGLAVLGAGGLAAGGLTGCGGDDDDGPGRPGGIDEGTPSERDWQRLSEQLSGRLVRPGSGEYGTALQLFDPAFDKIQPQAVAYCASASDVALAVGFARSAGIALAARSGGHSYGGYSTTTGLVIDVSTLNEVRPGNRSGLGVAASGGATAGSGVATVGAGAPLIDVYDQLIQAGAMIAAGSCPTVGIAGLTLGGGIGVLGRRHGLTCDQLLAAEVVLASGEIVQVDAERDADLFWALRGGGGGNFGVVTSFTFATHPATPLTVFSYRWPWDVAAEVVAAWQDWNLGADAPDELWSTCVVTTTTGSDGKGTPAIRVSGVLSEPGGSTTGTGTSSDTTGTGGGAGSRTALGGSAGSTVAAPARDLLAHLVDAVGSRPASTFAAQRGPLEAMLIESGCSGRSVAQCHLAGRHPDGTLQRAAQLAASNFLTARLPAAGTEAMLAAVEARQRETGLRSGGVILDSWGGAIGQVGPQDTAFVHRDVLASAQYVAGYDIGDSAELKARNAEWLRATTVQMNPYVAESAYQNYIDPELRSWEKAYYGSNLARLRSVKRAYDPDNVFAFAQSIRPA